MTIATRPEKSHPLFPATPSKTWGPVKPPFFENLFGGSTPPIPPPAERGVVHTVKSLCLVGRGVLSPYFMKTSPILPTSLPLFQILSTTPSSTPHLPLSCHSNPYSQLFFLSSCFFGWMGDHTFNVLFYLMIIWIYTIEPWNLSTRMTLFYATRH